MASKTVEIDKFDGLYLQANSFSEAPNGALEIGENVVISNDKKIYKRRGFYEYEDLIAGTQRALFPFQDNLISLRNDSVGYYTDVGLSPNETGNFNNNFGESVVIEESPKLAQYQDNLYFTAENGINKIEAYDDPVMLSGIPKALDLRGQRIPAGTAILNNRIVGYRIVFGRRDINSTLYIGAPSDIFEISNTSGGTVNIYLEFSVPDGIVDGDEIFYQVYRSTQSDTASATTHFLDYKFLSERVLTTAEIDRGFAQFLDTDLDAVLGAELYTNPNSREGELQANSTPPKSICLDVYKNHMMFSNAYKQENKGLQVVDSSSVVTGDVISILINGVTTYSLIAKTGSGNKTISAPTTKPALIRITSSAHGFIDNYEVYISNVNGGNLPEGLYSLTNTATNTFDLVGTSGFSVPTTVDYDGRTDGTNPIFYIQNTGSSSVDNREMAIYFSKAINRFDPLRLYSNYISVPTGTPGKISIRAIDFDTSFDMKASGLSGVAFEPILAVSYGAVSSDLDSYPHGLFVSKIDETEAVPSTNFFVIGARSKPIRRSFPLRDSFILLKDDGVYRLTGDTVTGFSISPLDTTIHILAPESAVLINNQVVFLSNQGVCLVNETSVQIISRKIENVITPILGLPQLAGQTRGLAYESERLYLLSTIKPNETSAGVTYVYNFLTDAWTSWDTTFDGGVIDSKDKLYLIHSNGNVYKERKNYTKIDYCEQNYNIGIVSVSSDLLSGTISSTVTPETGDIIVKDEVITRINSIAPNGINWDLTFDFQTNLLPLDNEILYSQYDAIIKFVPFTAGRISQMKHFSQFQTHLGDEAVTKISISFSGNYFGGSIIQEWERATIVDVGAQGFGSQPWGFFGFGEENSSDIRNSTGPANIIRTLIPRFQARNTFIQPVLYHVQAGERMNIQAIAYTLRAYKERVTK